MSRKSFDPPSGGTPESNNPKPVGDPSDNCNIDIDVDLAGVRADALALTSVGDTLSLRLDRAAERYDLIVCTRSTGEVVGSITNTSFHTALANCLKRKVNYEVVVTGKAIGCCHVVGGRSRS